MARSKIWEITTIFGTIIISILAVIVSINFGFIAGIIMTLLDISWIIYALHKCVYWYNQEN